MSSSEATATSASAPKAPVVMFKKGPRSRPVQSRRREPSPPADTTTTDEPSSSAVVRPTKSSITNPLVQGTKRRRTGQDDPAGNGGGMDEFDYKASDSGVTKGDDFATRSADWDLESVSMGDGPKEISNNGKRIRLNEDGEIDVDDGIYRGQANYLKTINTRTDTLRDSKMTAGPIRATANIRSITLIDYQPDVCKPYKQTGFCGYGDSCKFLHDRGDYLAGWQLDKLDPEDAAAAAAELEKEEEMIPFACLICKKEFNQPVVTKCGHYFCLDCAMKRFQKTPKCYACGAATNGIFNKAEKVLAKLEAKKKRRLAAKVEEEESAVGIQFGEDGDSEDGDSEDEEEKQEEDE